MGTYFLSSVLLLRMSLPPSYRLIITDVLGKMEFHFYQRWFDVIFLVSGVASICFLALARLQSDETLMALRGEDMGAVSNSGGHYDDLYHPPPAYNNNNNQPYQYRKDQ